MLYLVSGLVAFLKNKKVTSFVIFKLVTWQINHVTSQSSSSAVAHLSSAEVCGKPAVLLPSGTSERPSGRRSYRGCSVCTSSGLPADPAGFGPRECLGAQQPHRCEQYRSDVILSFHLITSVKSDVFLLCPLGYVEERRKVCWHTEVVKMVKLVCHSSVLIPDF